MLAGVLFNNLPIYVYLLGNIAEINKEHTIECLFDKSVMYLVEY